MYVRLLASKFLCYVSDYEVMLCIYLLDCVCSAPGQMRTKDRGGRRSPDRHDDRRRRRSRSRSGGRR